jgi:RNA polymerase sigma-70 factor (ECF subfamily)
VHYSEIELVSEIKKRNTNAFEFLVQEYTKPVYYLVFNILNTGGTKEDIEECVSDVFLEAWQKIGGFDNKRGSFKTWLLILAKHKALDYKRRAEKYAPEPFEDDASIATIDVEKQAADRETQQIIIKTIHTFNDVDRQLFIRRYFLGEDISTLMSSMGLSRSAVDNRLMRGRNKIKEALSYG